MDGVACLQPRPPPRIVYTRSPRPSSGGAANSSGPHTTIPPLVMNDPLALVNAPRPNIDTAVAFKEDIERRVAALGALYRNADVTDEEVAHHALRCARQCQQLAEVLSANGRFPEAFGLLEEAERVLSESRDIHPNPTTAALGEVSSATLRQPQQQRLVLRGAGVGEAAAGLRRRTLFLIREMETKRRQQVSSLRRMEREHTAQLISTAARQAVGTTVVALPKIGGPTVEEADTTTSGHGSPSTVAEEGPFVARGICSPKTQPSSYSAHHGTARGGATGGSPTTGAGDFPKPLRQSSRIDGSSLSGMSPRAFYFRRFPPDAALEAVRRDEASYNAAVAATSSVSVRHRARGQVADPLHTSPPRAASPPAIPAPQMPALPPMPAEETDRLRRLSTSPVSVASSGGATGGGGSRRPSLGDVLAASITARRVGSTSAQAMATRSRGLAVQRQALADHRDWSLQALRKRCEVIGGGLQAELDGIEARRLEAIATANQSMHSGRSPQKATPATIRRLSTSLERFGQHTERDEDDTREGALPARASSSDSPCRSEGSALDACFAESHTTPTNAASPNGRRTTTGSGAPAGTSPVAPVISILARSSSVPRARRVSIASLDSLSSGTPTTRIVSGPVIIPPRQPQQQQEGWARPIVPVPPCLPSLPARRRSSSSFIVSAPAAYATDATVAPSTFVSMDGSSGLESPTRIVTLPVDDEQFGGNTDHHPWAGDHDPSGDHGLDEDDPLGLLSIAGHGPMSPSSSTHIPASVASTTAFVSEAENDSVSSSSSETKAEKGDGKSDGVVSAKNRQSNNPPRRHPHDAGVPSSSFCTKGESDSSVPRQHPNAPSPSSPRRSGPPQITGPVHRVPRRDGSDDPNKTADGRLPSLAADAGSPTGVFGDAEGRHHPHGLLHTFPAPTATSGMIYFHQHASPRRQSAASPLALEGQSGSGGSRSAAGRASLTSRSSSTVYDDIQAALEQRQVASRERVDSAVRTADVVIARLEKLAKEAPDLIPCPALHEALRLRIHHKALAAASPTDGDGRSEKGGGGRAVASPGPDHRTRVQLGLVDPRSGWGGSAGSSSSGASSSSNTAFSLGRPNSRGHLPRRRQSVASDEVSVRGGGGGGVTVALARRPSAGSAASFGLKHMPANHHAIMVTASELQRCPDWTALPTPTLEMVYDLIKGTRVLQRAVRCWIAARRFRRRQEAVRRVVAADAARLDAAYVIMGALRKSAARRILVEAHMRSAYLTEQRVELERRGAANADLHASTMMMHSLVLAASHSPFAFNAAFGRSPFIAGGPHHAGGGSRRGSGASQVLSTASAGRIAPHLGHRQHSGSQRGEGGSSTLVVSAPSSPSPHHRPHRFAMPFSERSAKRVALLRIQRTVAQRRVAARWREYRERAFLEDQIAAEGYMDHLIGRVPFPIANAPDDEYAVAAFQQTLSKMHSSSSRVPPSLGSGGGGGGLPGFGHLYASFATSHHRLSIASKSGASIGPYVASRPASSMSNRHTTSTDATSDHGDGQAPAVGTVPVFVYAPLADTAAASSEDGTATHILVRQLRPAAESILLPRPPPGTTALVLRALGVDDGRTATAPPVPAPAPPPPHDSASRFRPLIKINARALLQERDAEVAEQARWRALELERHARLHEEEAAQRRRRVAAATLVQRCGRGYRRRLAILTAFIAQALLADSPKGFAPLADPLDDTATAGGGLRLPRDRMLVNPSVLVDTLGSLRAGVAGQGSKISAQLATQLIAGLHRSSRSITAPLSTASALNTSQQHQPEHQQQYSFSQASFSATLAAAAGSGTLREHASAASAAVNAAAALVAVVQESPFLIVSPLQAVGHLRDNVLSQEAALELTRVILARNPTAFPESRKRLLAQQHRAATLVGAQLRSRVSRLLVEAMRWRRSAAVIQRTWRRHRETKSHRAALTHRIVMRQRARLAGGEM